MQFHKPWESTSYIYHKNTDCCGQLWARQRLVMIFTTSHFTWSFWGTFRIPTDQVSPSQTLRCPGAFRFLPTGLHGLRFGFCFAGPLPLHSLSHGPLLSVHFGESLIIRLYSEIDHIHLSSEAQCVSHHLPHVPHKINSLLDLIITAILYLIILYFIVSHWLHQLNF